MTSGDAGTPDVVPLPSDELRARFGEIDIYLFDQIARGRFDTRRRVLDAGCGGGRNLVYFLQRGFDCYGVDRDARAVARLRERALATGRREAAAGAQHGRGTVAPDAPVVDAVDAATAVDEHFQVADLDALPWGDGVMEAVVCSAVLHFADDEAHFGRMVTELWRVLAPGGLWFARLASTIGIEDRVGPAGRRVMLPDGSTRFVVDEAMLVDWTARLGGRLVDPIKTTVVQGMRAMTTWCAEKTLPPGE